MTDMDLVFISLMFFFIAIGIIILIVSVIVKNLIKKAKITENDIERFEIFSRLPKDEKVKLIIKYQKIIDKTMKYVQSNDFIYDQIYKKHDKLVKLLRGE